MVASHLVPPSLPFTSGYNKVHNIMLCYYIILNKLLLNIFLTISLSMCCSIFGEKYSSTVTATDKSSSRDTNRNDRGDKHRSERGSDRHRDRDRDRDSRRDRDRGDRGDRDRDR